MRHQRPCNIVVLGGNALASPGGKLTMADQFRLARKALECLRPLLREGDPTLISHGNGPQVGHMLIRVEESLGKAYAIPLEVCVAESEGELGYVLEQSLYNVLAKYGEAPPIVSLLTQTIVEPDDPAFDHPSKPVGPFYEAEQADRLREKGYAIVEDAARGFRRVVPSPKPVEIVELEVIRRLLQMNVLVIAAGGGGIPVTRELGRLRGVDAVIDKDLTAALLARQLAAKRLIILTGVPCAYMFFGTPAQEPIGRIDAGEAQRLLEGGHFAAGSMAPKVEAAISFVQKTKAEAIICDPPSLADALQGRAGTIIRSAENRGD